jgi:hypothetical protein
MGRYVVRWHERAKDIFGDYSWYNLCEEECVRIHERDGLHPRKCLHHPLGTLKEE